MEITWIQAILLATCALLFSDVGALGPTVGVFTFGRPLVGTVLVGLIMGDLTSAILIGAAIQVVYIALVTPGGTMSADLRAVTFIGIPLAMIAVANTGLPVDSAAASGLAVSIGTLVGSVGTLMFYLTSTVNIVLPAYAWKQVDRHNFKGLYTANFILPLITHFVISFIPALLITRFGATAVSQLQTYLPIDGLFMKTLFTVGTMLPAVGIGILLKQVVEKATDFIPFFFGFTLAAVLGINLIGAAVVGAMFAVINYKFTISKTAAVTESYSEEDI